MTRDQGRATIMGAGTKNGDKSNFPQADRAVRVIIVLHGLQPPRTPSVEKMQNMDLGSS
jgi:hypothetical protein